MKQLLMIAASVTIAPLAAVAQSTEAEQEVRGFLVEFDKAVASRDITFLEQVLPDDYVYSSTSGRMSDREQVLAFFRRQRDKPTYSMHSAKHENVSVRAAGTMAVVTNDYTTQTTPIDLPDAEPETYKGRHTGVFAKRNGRWMVIAEQDSEQPQDDKLIEQEVVNARRKYNGLMKRVHSARSYTELERVGDIAGLDHFLADGYTSINQDGQMSTKAESMEGHKSTRIRLETVDLLEQHVRAIANGTAVETGKTRYVGTNAGKPFDITERYTTTWVSWDGWQIIANHASFVRQTD